MGTTMSTTHETTVTVNITDVEYMSTNGAGNPRFRILTDTGHTYTTEPGAAVGYAAENYRPRKHWGQAHITATLHLRMGNVTQIEGDDAGAVYDAAIEAARQAGPTR